MNEQILKLKKLNAAYIAALEYDRCPDPSKTTEAGELFETGLYLVDLRYALAENEGRRPDEIAGEISEVIKDL